MANKDEYYIPSVCSSVCMRVWQDRATHVQKTIMS